MNTIHFIIGDATAPQAEGNKIICHVCNDIGGWGRGFVVAITKRWPQPEQSYRAWHASKDHNDFALGVVQFVQVEPELWVANMIAQHDLTRRGVAPPDGRPPIRYDAVEAALGKVAYEARKLNATVHMPRIGCGLAGGTWEEIEPIIQRTLCEAGIEIFVYDLG